MKAASRTVALTDTEHEDILLLEEAEARARRLLFFFGARGNVAPMRSEHEWEDAIKDFAREHFDLAKFEDAIDDDGGRLSTALDDALDAVACAAQLLGLATGWRLAQGALSERSLSETFFSGKPRGAR